MRKTGLIILGSILFSMVLFSVVIASGTLTGDQDTGDNNGSGFLNIQSSGGVGCSVVNQVYLQFDVSSFNGTASNTTISTTLTIDPVFGSTGSTGNLNLYAATDGWSETDNPPTSTVDTAYGTAGLLTTFTLPASGPVSFSSADLNTFLNDQSSFTGTGDPVSGDDVASFIIRIEGCTAPSNQLFIQEGSPGGVPDWGGLPPRIDAYTPTAVEMSAVGTSSSDVKDTLLPLVALILMAITGTWFILRRRMTAAR